MMRKNIKNKEKQGSVLVVTLIILGMVLVIALSIASASLKERKASLTSSKSNVAYQSAESAMEKAMEVILQDLRETDEENASDDILISTVAGKIGTCSSCKINIDNYKSVEFMDANGANICCSGTDGNKDIYEVKKIKSIGADLQSQTQRSINAPTVQKEKELKVLAHFDKYYDSSDRSFADSSRTHAILTPSAPGQVELDNGNAKFGNSVFFKGNGYFIGPDIDLNSNSFTIDLWVKFDNPGSNEQALVDLNNSLGITYSYPSSDMEHLIIYKFGSGAENRIFYLNKFGNDSSIQSGWHHVAVVRNAEDSDAMALYIDGDSVLPETGQSTFTGSVSGTLYIGDGGGDFSADRFEGNMDELRIYEGISWPQGLPPEKPY